MKGVVIVVKSPGRERHPDAQAREGNKTNSSEYGLLTIHYL